MLKSSSAQTKMKTQPAVSIGLPVYNGDSFLAEALDSLLQQSFTDFEIVISDNASTDQTEQICIDYAKKDHRIRYYRSQKNRGAAWNFNRAFKLATGEYFKWAAHDDFCAPTYIESCIEALRSDDSIVLCHSKTVLVDRKSQRIPFDPSINCFVSQFGHTFRNHDHSKHLNSAKPYKRYIDLLFSARWCFEVFGLIRADVLEKTSLIGSYYGSDKVLLAELALLGRFDKSTEELFFRRCQANQSSMINSTVERELWITSEQSTKSFISPRLTCLFGYLQAVFKARLTVSESTACLIGLTWWSISLSNWQRFISEIRREVTEILAT